MYPSETPVNMTMSNIDYNGDYENEESSVIDKKRLAFI